MFHLEYKYNCICVWFECDGPVEFDFNDIQDDNHYTQGRYVLLSQILEDHEFPHIAKLESCIDEDQLKNICDATSRFSSYYSAVVETRIRNWMAVLLKIKIFCRLLITGPMKMYSKFGQLKWILVSHMLKLVGKWSMTGCSFSTAVANLCMYKYLV